MKATQTICTILTLSASLGAGSASTVSTPDPRRQAARENGGVAGRRDDDKTGLLVPTSPITITGSLSRRQHRCEPGQRLVYSFPNSSGSYAVLCVGNWVLASCTIIGVSWAFSGLADRIAGWVGAQTTDASDAGPQVGEKGPAVDPVVVTWGELYNYTQTQTHAGDGKGVFSTSGQSADSVVLDAVALAMEVHEDGFSASFNLSALQEAAAASSSSSSSPPDGAPLPLGEGKRSNCNEQVHIHYWAARGHESTALDSDSIHDLAYHALEDSYLKDYSFSCYEMDNSGDWDGWLRVCYNYNLPQRGCGECGGHEN